MLCQDGRTPAGVAGWVDALCDSGHPATAEAGACDLGIDYARYGAGEEALAWLDAEVRVNSAEGGCRETAGRLVRAIVAEVSDAAYAIGHVKFLIRDHLYDIKVSHTAADEAPDQVLLDELRQLDRLSDRQLYVVVNVRAEIGAERLQRILDLAVAAPADGATHHHHPLGCIPPRPSATGPGDNPMSERPTRDETWNETLIEQTVTYHIEIEGRLVLVENVPARVNVETGERHFSPETVERLQQAVWERCRPVRVIETPVFEYATLT